MTLYEALLLFHILAAIAWVGGTLTLQILGARMMASGDAALVAGFSRMIEWLGPRLYMPASVAVLGLGMAMVAVNDAWTAGQLWIILALVGLAASAIGGALFFGPQARRIAHAIDAEGVESGRTQALIRRLFVVGRFDTLLLLLIVVDMVIKPGL